MDIQKLKEQLLSDPEVHEMVRRRSYEIYLERRHTNPHATQGEDWLRAESEILPRLIHEMVVRNREAIDSQDASDPVTHRAAEHMHEELEHSETRAAARSTEAAVAGRELLSQNAEALATSTEAEATETVPNASGVLAEHPVKPAAGARKAATKPKSAEAPAQKAAPKKAAAKKAPAEKAAPKKAATTKAPAEKAAPKKTAAKKAPAKAPKSSPGAE